MQFCNARQNTLASYYLISFYYQEMELFVYLEAVLIMDYSKYITMGYGDLFVVMDGTEKRVLLLVGSWVSFIMSPIVVIVELTLIIGLVI